MNISETIQQKVFHLPLGAQEEVLEIVERMEERYETKNGSRNGKLSDLFGSVSLGRPLGADNNCIDADISDEIVNRHEESR